MKFDDVFEYVGEIGLYQALIFLITCMVSVFGVDAVAVNFVAGYMDHWCQVDGLEEVPYEHQKYIAIPQAEDDVYSNCEYFNINYANYTTEELRHWNRTTMIGANTTTSSCDSWVYDQGEFVSTAVNKFDLVCSRQDFVPLISTLSMVGVMVGSFISGFLSDRLGRRPTFVMFVGVKIAAGFMGTFAPNFIVFSISRVLLGAGGFSAYLAAYVLVMELVGPVYRTFLGVGFQIAYALGMIMVSGMSYNIRDDTWLQLAYLVPYGTFLLSWWIIPESPRWLILRGKFEEANSTIRRIALINRRKLPADFDSAKIEEEEEVVEGSCGDLYKSRTLRSYTIVINLFWFTVNLIYYAMSFNIGYLSGSIFVNTVISGAVEIPSNIVCILLCNWRVTGRRLTCSLSLILAGVSCFIRIGLIVENLEDIDTAFSFVGRAFVTIAFSGIYVFAAEVFPTEVRNTAMAHAVIFSQISGIVSPYVGGPLTRVWAPLPALIFGVLSLASGFSALVLPETLGKPLYETVDEFNKLDSKNKQVSAPMEYGNFQYHPNISDEPTLDTIKKPSDETHIASHYVNPGYADTAFATKL